MTGSDTETVKENDYVLLYFDERRKWLTKVLEGREFHTHKGIVKVDALIGKSYGDKVVSSLDFDFWILRPTTYDYVMRVERPTQIMYPKDIGIILLKLGICSGKTVVEAGTGSAAMTIAIATAVKPEGHLYTYEIRPEFAETAERNLRRAGVIDYATIRNLDASAGFQEKNVDAVTIDIGEPWKVLSHAYDCLKGGCPLASFSPTVNQVERTVTALKQVGFIDVDTIECLVRAMRVEEGKTRPATTMISHTGYVTFGRKILR
jgi:tRNA (adenine57-N1/adenine58-N1)-methyltransferase